MGIIMLICGLSILAVCLIFGFVGRAIVKSKGYEYDNHGFAWGFWLGIIGVIVCAGKPTSWKYKAFEQLKIDLHLGRITNEEYDKGKNKILSSRD